MSPRGGRAHYLEDRDCSVPTREVVQRAGYDTRGTKTVLNIGVALLRQRIICRYNHARRNVRRRRVVAWCNLKIEAATWVAAGVNF